MMRSFESFKFCNKSLYLSIILSTITMLVMIVFSVILNEIALGVFFSWLFSLYINIIFYIYCNNTIEYMKDIYYLDNETEKMNRMGKLRNYYKKQRQIKITLLCLLIEMLSFSAYNIIYAFTNNKVMIPIVYYLIACISNKTVLTKWMKLIKVLYKCAKTVDKNNNEVINDEETV